MKKIYQTIVLLLISTQGFTQDKPTKITNFNFNTSNSSWETTSQTTFEYYRYDDSISSITQTYDPILKEWSNQSNKEEVLIKGQFSNETIKVWTGDQINGKFENNNKRARTFIGVYHNGQNYFIPENEFTYLWNGANQFWDTTKHIEFNSNKLSQLINYETHYIKSNNTWANDQKIVYQYYSNKNIYSEEFSNWINENWQKDLKVIYEYHGYSSKYSLVLTEKFDVKSSTYLPATKMVSMFNGYNNEDSSIYYDYDAKNQTYVEAKKVYFEYDEQRRLTTQTTVVYDKNNNQWVNNNKVVYSYDPINSNKEIGKSPISVYPNPSSGLVFIGNNSAEYHNVQVSNLLGKTVYSMTKLQAQQPMDLSSLANGFYFVTFKSNEKTIQKKIRINH